MARYLMDEALKKTLSLENATFVTEDITAAINAAEDGIDAYCGRRFDQDASDKVRYYSPTGNGVVFIDDLVSLTSVASDPSGDGSFPDSWTVNTDFVLSPRNAQVDGRPYSVLRRLATSNYYRFPAGDDTVKVTGKFGWPAVPSQIKEATSILAGRLLRRSREAPFGVVVVAGLDVGAAAQIARTDPDVRFLLDPFTRWRPFV